MSVVNENVRLDDYTKLTEPEYRALDIDSYSSISQFLSDRKKYYKRYVLKMREDDEETQSLTFGSLVDCMLFSPEDFDKRFIVSTAKVPTGQMLEFCNALYNITMNIVRESGCNIQPAKTSEDNYKSAYSEVGFKRDTLDKVIAKFEKEGEAYYNELLRSGNKYVISKEDHSRAQRCVDGLRNSPVTASMINRKSDDRCDVYYQLPIVFVYNGLPLKCLPDMVIVDHERKRIKPYDLKTTYNSEEFVGNYYKYKYYIQAAVYWLGVRSWATDKGYIKEGYTVDYMEFIVADSFNYMSPLIYTTGEENYAEGLGGYYSETHRKQYSGLSQAVEELKWHKKNNIWNISHNNFHNEGIVEIPIGI